MHACWASGHDNSMIRQKNSLDIPRMHFRQSDIHHNAPTTVAYMPQACGTDLA